MFMRPETTDTIADIREKLDDGAETVTCINTQVHVELTEDTPRIRFGDQTSFEVPATPNSIEAIGNWVEVPSKFLHRLGNLDLQAQQDLLTALLRNQPGTMAIRFTDAGIVEVRDPSIRVIDPRRLVDVAASVISPEAPVLDFWSTGDEFRLDVIVPTDFDSGWGGDRQEGDITGGGLRIGQDKKKNLAPWVSSLLYRLACTNGYEMWDEGLKIDARGQTAEQVLVAFNDACNRAFARVDHDIAEFYSLRSQVVEDPTQEVIRMAQEHNLPDRTAMRLAERVPAITDGDGRATRFDLVNLLTNAANDPLIRGRTGVRRNLETTGGSIITTHAERCGHCSSKLSD